MEKKISNIVFTKNRPLQLDAYLRSLYRYFPSNIIQTYILYKPELFGEQYGQLFGKYPGGIVIKESDFHSDFLNILNEISTKYILFGIDDVVYFDSVDFDLIDETFNRFAEDIFGFSLRFGLENIKRGGDSINETSVAGQTIYNIDWTQGRTSTTRYPFELCATIYSTELVKRIINSASNNNSIVKKLFSPDSILIKALGNSGLKRKVLKRFGYFYAPNTLESWNCRWCQRQSEQLPAYIYFQRHCASAVQVNMVNTVTSNESDDSAEHTVEALAKKYEQGYRLDTNFVAKHKPSGTHCGNEYFCLCLRAVNK